RDPDAEGRGAPPGGYRQRRRCEGEDRDRCPSERGDVESESLVAVRQEAGQHRDRHECEQHEQTEQREQETPGARVAPSIASSHTRAARSASAGNATSAWCGSLDGISVKAPMTVADQTPSRSQRRARASCQGRLNARATAQGNTSAQGRKPRAVRLRNPTGPSAAPSSGARRGRVSAYRWLSTTMCRSAPGLRASIRTYQGTAIATVMRTPHHGIHGPTGRSRVSQKKAAMTGTTARASRKSRVSMARARAA